MRAAGVRFNKERPYKIESYGNQYIKVFSGRPLRHIVPAGGAESYEPEERDCVGRNQPEIMECRIAY